MDDIAIRPSGPTIRRRSPSLSERFGKFLESCDELDLMFALTACIQKLERCHEVCLLLCLVLDSTEWYYITTGQFAGDTNLHSRPILWCFK